MTRAEEHERQNGKSKLGHQMKGTPPEGSHGTRPLPRSWRSTKQDHGLLLERGNVPVGSLSFRRRDIVRLSAEPVALTGQRSGRFPAAPCRWRDVLSCPSFDFPFGGRPGCGGCPLSGGDQVLPARRASDRHQPNVEPMARIDDASSSMTLVGNTNVPTPRGPLGTRLNRYSAT